MKQRSIKENVLVLHVKKGYEEREKHINKMLQRLNIPFVYITGGDIDEINQAVLDNYFSGIMYEISAQTSCTYKHLIAYKYILDHNLSGALILEDDIILHKCFARIFNCCMLEYQAMGAEQSCLISFENSRLRFVPRSARQKGKYLYRGDKDRMAGAYFISRKAASDLLNYAAEYKISKPIDLLHNQLLSKNKLIYYWCEPAIATQGSFCGLFQSSLSHKSRLWKLFSWKFKLVYKKLLYNLR